MTDKGQNNRQKIVDAANALIYQKGYNQTSFSEIADAAGLPRGNFYYYFKSKDDILASVVEDRIGRIRAMLAEWDEGLSEPRDRLMRFVDILPRNQEDVIRYGCPMGSLNAELGKTQLSLQAKAEAMFNLYRVWLERQFRELGYGGKSRHMAMHLMARAQGIAMVGNVHADTDFLLREAELLKEWVVSL